MAIAYKSAGSGVSTETSAAALSPLCPATVDAGDILIAHVFWEGTTTAPSTPSGWDLLSGPHVIETTIARHWVFGRIADGSEDGAAVAFGNPAVTTQRAARIYSFSGRVSGTITQLVTGFSHQSHATDPAMPTVTTTKAGARAVALMAQNDNNTSGDATGATGGTWTEAVAEYVAALTPGLQLQIQTCVPTANPGTVSGGTVATTNDPCGVIGFQILDEVVITGTSAPTLDAATQTASGEQANVGTSTPTLADATQSATGEQANPVTGTSDQTLAAATQSATGEQANVGTSSPTLADATQTATAEEVLSGTAASTLDAAASGATTGPQDFTCEIDTNAPGGISTSGSNITSLNDLSGNARHFSQATSGDQATTVTDGGKTVGEFTFAFGVQKFYDSASASFFGANWTACARVKPTNTPSTTQAAGINQTNAYWCSADGGHKQGAFRTNSGQPESTTGAFNGSFTQFRTSQNVSVNTWYDVIIRKVGNDLVMTMKPVGSGSSAETSVTVTGTMQNANPHVIRIGGNTPGSNQFFNGRLQRFRTYDYDLTDQQVENVISEWDGGTTTEGKVTIEGTSAPTLDAATQSATGEQANVGSSSTTLSDATQSAAGEQANVGTASSTLSDATQSASGEQANVGSAASTLDAATQTASGDAIVDVTGTTAQTLDDAAQTASGEQANVGSASSTLADATQTATAEQANAGSASSTLDAATQSASGEQANVGTASSTLGDATQSASGEQANVGAASSVLADATQSASGDAVVDVVGTSTPTLDSAEQSASGEEKIEGAASSTLDPVVHSANGAFGDEPTGTQAVTLDDATHSGTGTVTAPDVTGAQAVTLEPAQSNASGELATEGTAASTLAGADQTASGIVAAEVVGSAASTLADAAQNAAGDVSNPVSGTAASTLSSLTHIASGTLASPEGTPPAETTSAITARLPADRAMLGVSSSRALVPALLRAETHIKAIFSGRE